MKRLYISAAVIVIICSSIVVYCYYNFQFWTHLKTLNFGALTEYNGENISGLRGKQILVHKNFVPYLRAIDNYAQKNNITLIVNQSYRFNGQILSRSIVNPANLSNHLAGFAIDSNIKHNRTKYFSNDLRRNNISKLPKDIQNFIMNIRNDETLRWGGDFMEEDPIHIDNPINLKSRDEWLSYCKLCYDDYSEAIPKYTIWIRKRK